MAFARISGRKEAKGKDHSLMMRSKAAVGEKTSKQTRAFIRITRDYLLVFFAVAVCLTNPRCRRFVKGVFYWGAPEVVGLSGSAKWPERGSVCSHRMRRRRLVLLLFMHSLTTDWRSGAFGSIKTGEEENMKVEGNKH